MSYKFTCTDDDEALARALQEEYEKEYRRRSMQQHLRQVQSPSNISSSRMSSRNPPPTAPEYQETGQQPATRQTSTIFPTQTLPSTQQRSAQDIKPIRQSQVLPSTRQPIDRSLAQVSSSQGTTNRREMSITNQAGSSNGASSNRSSSSRNLSSASNNISSSRQYPSATDGSSYRCEMNKSNREVFSNVALSNRSSSNRNLSRESSNTRSLSSSRNSRQELDDEEFARQLERQLRAQDAPETNRTSSSRSMQVSRQLSASRYDSRSSSRLSSDDGMVVVGGRILTDEEIARRIAQEERDAALARGIAEADATRTAVATQKTLCGQYRRCLSYLITFIMCTIAAGMLYWYFASPTKMPSFIPNMDQFRQEDPFSSMNATDANRWPNKGKGLEMTVINALDTLWNDYFYKAVSEWDNGTPNALNLQTQLGTPESVCTPVDGYIKVCNGNYGATNWRGINKVLLENGDIYASAARMNEFYFSGTDLYQRQYTMCHEMGHGFGLPHSDENFYNKDLGNCMDYTMHPEVNMQPDKSNFQFLANLYGTFDGSWVPTNQSAVQSSAAVPPTNATAGNGGPNGGGDGPGGGGPGNRKLSESRTSLQRRRMIGLSRELDSFLDDGYGRQTNNRLRMLRSNEFVEEYEVDLGNGFTVQYHLLLV